jgi:cell division protein FtsN
VSVLAILLVGVVLGLAIAASVAWYILQRTPASFVNKEAAPVVKAQSDASKAAIAKSAVAAMPVPDAASGVAGATPRFTFYNVLTDKPDAATGEKVVKDKEKNAASALDKAIAKEIYYLQAGSFPNAEDADKLKAKITMAGLEASVQAAPIPDKGTWYRVRLGPYKGAEEMNKAIAVLKANGVAATPMRAQGWSDPSHPIVVDDGAC